MRTTLGLIVALCAMFVAANGSQAQSFDCQRVATPTEQAICDSRALSNLDMKMGTL